MSLIAIGILPYSNVSIANVYKCKNSEGVIAFQQSPCTQEEKSMDVGPHINYAARPDALHKKTPHISSLKPDCKKQRQKCICGTKSYSTRYTRKIEINKYMAQLINSWEKYNLLFKKLKTYSSNSNSQYKGTHKSLVNLGCEILVYQKKVNDRHEYSKNMIIRNIQIIENRADNAIKNRNPSAESLPIYVNRHNEMKKFISLSRKVGINVDYKY